MTKRCAGGRICCGMKRKKSAPPSLTRPKKPSWPSERNRLANSEQLATLAAEAARLLNGDDSARAAPAVDSLMGRRRRPGRSWRRSTRPWPTTTPSPRAWRSKRKSSP